MMSIVGMYCTPEQVMLIADSLPHIPSRLMAQCEEFLTEKGFVPPGQFFCDTPPEHAPHYIVTWIMNVSVYFCFMKHGYTHCVRCRCDELNFDKTPRPSDEMRATYGTAQKMRASMTYAFGHIHGLGSMHWQRSPLGDGMVGNPSVSEVVSRYMVSLHRRKVQAGETATSARAISVVCLLL
jgi:hypothetical protein